MDQDSTRSGNPKLSRRKFLALTGSSTAAFILASCSAPSAPAPTAAPKSAAAPSGPAPTAAPRATLEVRTPIPKAANPVAAPAIGPAEKSKVVWASTNPNYANQAPIFIGIDKGYYKEEGLDTIEVVNTDQVKEGMIGGSIDVGHQDTGPMVLARLQDVKMMAIAPWRVAEFSGYAVKRELAKDVMTWDGKTMRTSAITEREHKLRLEFMKKYGFDTSKVKVNWIVTAGGSDPSAQMFADGKLDGTLVYPRHFALVEPTGTIIFFERMLWPQEVLTVTEDFITKYPNLITRFLRATIRSMTFFVDDKNKDYVIPMMESKGFKIAQNFKDTYNYETVQYVNDMGFDEKEIQAMLKSWEMSPVPKTSSFCNLKFLWAAQQSLGYNPRPDPATIS